jgi:DNA-directed RNA polymerase subunit beta
MTLADQLRIVEADTFGRIERLLTGKTAPRTESRGARRSPRPISTMYRYQWFEAA